MKRHNVTEALIRAGWSHHQIFKMTRKSIFAEYLGYKAGYRKGVEDIRGTFFTSDIWSVMRELWPEQIEEIERQSSEEMMKQLNLTPN